jgi:hypothetical protein
MKARDREYKIGNLSPLLYLPADQDCDKPKLAQITSNKFPNKMNPYKRFKSNFEASVKPFNLLDDSFGTLWSF